MKTFSRLISAFCLLRNRLASHRLIHHLLALFIRKASKDLVDLLHELASLLQANCNCHIFRRSFETLALLKFHKCQIRIGLGRRDSARALGNIALDFPGLERDEKSGEILQIQLLIHTHHMVNVAIMKSVELPCDLGTAKIRERGCIRIGAILFHDDHQIALIVGV